MASTFDLELVTAESRLISEAAEYVRLPGLDGEFGVYPKHVAVLTPLRPGEVKVQYPDRVEEFFVSGGFVEVLPDRVVILADAAERSDEIDAVRAEEARQRAQEALSRNEADAAAAASLERAMMRIRVAELKRHRGARPPKAPS